MTIELKNVSVPREKFLKWMEYVTPESEDEPRLVLPTVKSDMAGRPDWTMDISFDSVEHALEEKQDIAPDADWVLVRVKYKPVLVVSGKKTDVETI
jgi:hypothetical protein